MKKNEKTLTAGYLKIRRYMLHFVEEAGERSVLAPSIIELSRKFELSRPTVSKAMKTLTDDGYIIGHPGVGSFTNPAKRSSFLIQRYRKAGVVVGDGMMANYGPYHLEQMGNLLSGLARLNLEAEIIPLTTHQWERAMEEISMISSEFLIWLMPTSELTPTIRELRKNGKTVIVSGGERKMESDVYFDYEAFGYRIGQKLLDEHRSRIVYLFTEPAAWARPVAGLERAFREKGMELDRSLFFTEKENWQKRLAAVLSTPGKADAVFSSVCPKKIFMPLYRSIPEKVRKNVRFIVEQDHSSASDFSGWLFTHPFQTLNDEILLRVQAFLNGSTEQTTPSGIPPEIIEQNTGDGI